MKKIIATVAVALVIGSGVAQAQTTNTIPNFFAEAAGWATSFDTNKSWTPVAFQMEDGLNQTTGTGASDYIRGQYNMGRWNLTAEGDFFGIGSTFNAIEGGVGFALIQKYDFKAEINVLLGVTKQIDSGGVNASWKFKAEPEIKITKLMTANTYSTISISVPWIEGQKFDGTPAFRVGMGFTF
jgi:opacity protein-like surface antigen